MHYGVRISVFRVLFYLLFLPLAQNLCSDLVVETRFCTTADSYGLSVMLKQLKGTSGAKVIKKIQYVVYGLIASAFLVISSTFIGVIMKWI